MGGEAWWAAIYGVTQSQTQLKWLSSSRSLSGHLSIYTTKRCRFIAGITGMEGQAVHGGMRRLSRDLIKEETFQLSGGGGSTSKVMEEQAQPVDSGKMGL